MPEISTPEQVEIKKIAIRSEKFLDGRELLLAGIDNDAPVALALESRGFRRYGDNYSLFENQETEELDINTYKLRSGANHKKIVSVL
mgnify:CR=1 FL=1